MSEFQQVASVDLGQLSTGGNYKQLAGALGAERAVAGLESILPESGTRTLNSAQASQLLSTLLTGEIGEKLLPHINKAGIESASISRSGAGFDIKIALGDDVSASADELGLKNMPFSTVEVSDAINMNVAISKDAITVKPAAGSSDIGIGFGNAIATSYAEELKLTSGNLHFDGTWGKTADVKVDNGIQAASKGILAFTEAVGMPRA